MVLIAVLILLLFPLAGVGLSRRRFRQAHALVYGGMAVLCAAMAAAAVLAIGGVVVGSEAVQLPLGLPWAPSRLRIDPLAAFFLLVVNLGGAAACAFGIGCARHEPESDRILPLIPLFLAAMDLVLVADDAFAFLLAWGLLSVVSWLLVLSAHREPPSPPAARIYLLTAAFGMVCLLLGFVILADGTGEYGFGAIRTHVPAPFLAGLAAFLVILGTGAKAGLVPFHVWLPLVHPTVPAHVSVLMSGAMTKVALYGMIRVIFDLMAETQGWWGGALAGIGAATAATGALFALLQDDLKRLVACSTIGNVGTIAVGLGLALVYKGTGMSALAALALSAALLHILNHSLFKSLLFLGTGSVAVATGTRDLDRLGGLIHRMPVTALLFLAGAAATASLPPLNGFAGEWMVFQALLNGSVLGPWVFKVGIAVIGALLAFSIALTAAGFVRAFGIAFLGRARSPEAETAREAGPVMLWAMAVLAGLCLLLGILPKIGLILIDPVTRLLIGQGVSEGGGFLHLAPAGAFETSYSGFLVLVLLAFLGASTLFAVRRWGGRGVRRVPVWQSGFEDPVPLGQYGASGFAQPLRRLFATRLLAARDSVDMPAPGDTRPARFATSHRDPAWDLLFAPIGRGLSRIAAWTEGVQHASIRRDLTLVFLTLVGLLILVTVFR